MVKTFYLIRHGDKIKTVGDPSLSEKGVHQAVVTAIHMTTLPVQQVITSPILRAQQTAELLADKLNIPIQTEPLLRERVNWGDDPTQSFDDFLSMWERATLEREWIPPIGDSSRGAGDRLQQVIESYNDPYKYVALVTHGGIIADFMCNVFNDSELEQAFPGFSKTKENTILECSLSIVEYNPTTQQYRLKLLASTDHLTNL